VIANPAAATRCHPAGIELIVTVGDDLHAAETFTAATVEGLEAAAGRHRAAFLAEGWTVGPRE
jgi:hypothetical protein